MKKFYFYLFLLFSCSNLALTQSAYDIDFEMEVLHNYLPSPDDFTNAPQYDMSGNYVGAFMGKKPPNFNGTVLSIHAGLGMQFESAFIQENSMYKKLYDLGYGVAFINNRGFAGDFFNGQVIANSVDAILNHFDVEKLNLVGFSNGGVANEIAFTLYEIADRVDKVYSIGTPYFGTEIADFVSVFPTPILKGFASFLNILATTLVDATAYDAVNDPTGFLLSTTNFRKSILRPMIDGHPLNRPEDFIIAASSEFIDLNTPEPLYIPLNAIMGVTGAIITVLGQNDENDGITPFYSSKRPGATIYDEFRDLKRNHIHLTFGQDYTADLLIDMLKKVESEQSTISYRTSRSREIKIDRNSVYKSNYQIGAFTLDKDNTNATIFSVGPNAVVESTQSETAENNSPNARYSKMTREGINDLMFKEYEIKDQNQLNNISYRTSQENINDQDLNFLIQEGINVVLTVDYNDSAFDTNQNPYPMLKLKIDSEENIDLNNLKITAVANKLSELLGESTDVEEQITLSFEYDATNNQYVAKTLNQTWGIYGFSLSVENDDFKRDLIGNYSVGTLFKEIDLTDENESSLSISNVKSRLYLSASNGELLIKESDLFASINTPTVISIFTINGAFVGQSSIDENDESYTVSLSENVQVNKGDIYFITMKKGDKTESYKILAK